MSLTRTWFRLFPPCLVCAFSGPPGAAASCVPAPRAPGTQPRCLSHPGLVPPAAPPLRRPRLPRPPPRPRVAAPRAASLRALGGDLPLTAQRRGEAATLPLPAGATPPRGPPRPGAKFKNLRGAGGWLRKRKLIRAASRLPGSAGSSAPRYPEHTLLPPFSAGSGQAPRSAGEACSRPRGRRAAWTAGTRLAPGSTCSCFQVNTPAPRGGAPRRASWPRGPTLERAERPAGAARGRTSSWGGAGPRRPWPCARTASVPLPRGAPEPRARALRAPGPLVRDQVLSPARCAHSLQLTAGFAPQSRKRRNAPSVTVISPAAVAARSIPGLRRVTRARGLGARCGTGSVCFGGTVCRPPLFPLSSGFLLDRI